jgi:pimeloyl-ACP methyl ester carboxylesterase
MTGVEFRQINGVRIAFRDQGTGPNVLMLHGLGSNGTSWDAQANALVAQHRVIRPDFRGFGESERPVDPSAYSVEIFANDVHRLLDELGAWPACVVGTSMGGYVALTLALRDPLRVKRLVLCHTACSRKVPPAVMAERLAALRSGDMGSYAATAVGHALSPDTSLAVRRKVQEMLAANDQQAYLAVFGGQALDFDLCARLDELRMPTLVIAGENDQVVPVERSRQLAAGIFGARFVQIPGTGHLSYMERPAAFNDVLLPFLADAGVET